MSARVRLDRLIVERSLAPTRARARDAVLRGTVTVDGVLAERPGGTVPPDARIEIDDPASEYVSRAALKLVAGLDAFAIEVAGRRCLDIGASTGGFTQVLLARGAASVTAIDVGHGQMHPQIAADPRVASIEGLNARNLNATHLAHPPDIVVCDVSFIPLALALPPSLGLAAPGAHAVILVKPQFEVGRARIGKGGIVDAGHGEQAARAVADWLDRCDGWAVIGIIPSPVTGGDGNREYLLGARHD